MSGTRTPIWLSALFWTAAVLTVLLVLIPTLDAWNHPSGQFAGLGVFFFLVVDAFVAGVILVVAAFRRAVAYWVGLALLSLLAALFGADAITRAVERANMPSEAEYRATREAHEAGRGYFTKDADRALADAMVAGDATKVAVLAPAANLRAVGDSDMTFLQLALADGRARLDVVSALLEAGADPDQYYGNLFSPIETAPDKRDGKDGMFVRVALEAGVDLNAWNKEGRPRSFGPLCWSTTANIEFMLAHGVNLEAEDRDGDTAIAWLVRWCGAKNVEFLLAHGAHADHRNHAGKNLRDVVLAEADSLRPYHSASDELNALEAKLR